MNSNFNQDSDEFFFSISEICKMLNISASALRFYESKGLISPSRNHDSNYRQYSYKMLIQLSDIMLYRNLEVPLNLVEKLLQAPAGEVVEILDQTMDETHRKIIQMHDALHLMSVYERRIRKYLALLHQSEPFRIISQPPIKMAVPFRIQQDMPAYIANPYTFAFGIYIDDLEKSSDYSRCIIDPEASFPKRSTVWSRHEKNERYVEFLMRTEYSTVNDNNLDELFSFMSSQGIRPGHLIGQYLVYDYSSKDNKLYDYYQTWVQIIPD